MPAAAARSTRPALPRPPRALVRRDGGTWTLQAALHRKGLSPIAGVDEAGRGACAGPLVVAACVLRPADAAALDGLTDSKLLPAPRREHYYDLITARAVAHNVVVIPPEEVDGLGLHVANLEGMRRAVAGLVVHPGYILTDGFRVPGLTAPNMAVIGGDRATACVAAASVLAKVTRDRIMVDLHAQMPWYGFDEHKGYCTPEHNASLLAHGPCTEHRFGYVNVALAARRHAQAMAPRRMARARARPEVGPDVGTDVNSVVAPLVVQNGEIADRVWARAGGATTP
jgi:ribonuclease HII